MRCAAEISRLTLQKFHRSHSDDREDSRMTGKNDSVDEQRVKYWTVVFKHMRKFAQPAINELAERIDKLDERIAAVEKQEKAMRYRGVWQPAETYERGNLTTFDGSLWIAIADAPGKPGEKGWQLAAKRGRDSK
jgi:hypothetical protein